jgi:hypothetical protein
MDCKHLERQVMTMSTTSERIFDRVLIIVLENEYRSYVMNNPYMRWLAGQGIELANHFGNMHPSQTNYVSSVAGELCNITYDWPPYPPLLPQRTIVDLLEEAPRRLRWKAYLEGNVKTLWRPDLQPSDAALPFPVPSELWATLPEPFKSLPQPLYPYAYFHNPFFAFERILRNRQRWDLIEDESAFWRDLLLGEFPEFAWFSPNLWNDGHYLYGTCDEPGDRTPLVAQQAEWLKSFFANLRFPGPKSRLPPRTLVVVTYDEADFDADYDRHVANTYDGPNQIYTVLLGDMIKPGVQTEGSNHYSMLKTIEKNFGLPSLGKNDHDSNWWQFLWGRTFGWEPPVETPIVTAGAVAAAALGNLLYVVYVGDGSALKYRTFDGTQWSTERKVAAASATDVALTALGDHLVLVCKETSGSLSQLTYEPGSGWSDAPVSLVPEPVGAFSLATIEFNRTAMLAYAQSDGALSSMALTANGWGEPVPVGFRTDGKLILAVLGPSLYLIYKAVGTDQMNVVSYNTADFNTVTIPVINGGPDSDTSVNLWSPSEYPVAFYWRGPAPRTPNANQPLLLPYLGGQPFAAATLDGVIHLAHPQPTGPQVMTETFSLSGIMTPKNPIAWITEAQAGQRTGARHRSRYSIWARFLDRAVTAAGGVAAVGAAAAQDAAALKDKKPPTSNGFGTLAEAGWSVQHPIRKVSNNAAGGLVMARLGSRLVLLSQPRQDGKIRLSVGGYIDAGSRRSAGKPKARGVKAAVRKPSRKP